MHILRRRAFWALFWMRLFRAQQRGIILQLAGHSGSARVSACTLLRAIRACAIPPVISNLQACCCGAAASDTKGGGWVAGREAGRGRGGERRRSLSQGCKVAWSWRGARRLSQLSAGGDGALACPLVAIGGRGGAVRTASHLLQAASQRRVHSCVASFPAALWVRRMLWGT